jgi:hypothetical protein
MGPRASAIAVAVAYPKIPIRSAGNTSRFQSLACAMAAAVVGPPTLALDARYSSRLGRRKSPFPRAINVAKWTPICMDENAKRAGACCRTRRIDPAAPDAAKNI